MIHLQTLKVQHTDTAAVCTLVILLIESIGWPDPMWSVEQLQGQGDAFKSACKASDHLRTLLGHTAPTATRAQRFVEAVWGDQATHKVLVCAITDSLQQFRTAEKQYGLAVLERMTDAEKKLCACPSPHS